MLALTKALADRQDRIRNNDKGFTLIELLVVVIIIGILAAIAIPIFLGQQESAKGSAVESAIANAKIDVVADIVEDVAVTAGTITQGDPDITLTLVGDEAGFCISGVHADLTGASWAADDISGVLEGNCAGVVATFVANP